MFRTVAMISYRVRRYATDVAPIKFHVSKALTIRLALRSSKANYIFDSSAKWFHTKQTLTLQEAACREM